jgi:hypothetical protein
MNKQYLNIAIAGLSIHDSDELKHQLSNILPNHFSIQWKTASDVNLDCLFIHENFYDTEGIQRILNTRCLPWLKISKNPDLSGKVESDTLYLPIANGHDLNIWVKNNVLQITPNPIDHMSESKSMNLPAHFNAHFFHNMMDRNIHTRVHLFDQKGTLGIIDLNQNVVWLSPERQPKSTDHTFNFEIASTTNLARVSRKERFIMQDWVWNLFWYSPNFYQICPTDGDFKIYFWPKPDDKQNKKNIFYLSAYFIQGANIKEISECHNIPLPLIRQFLAANIAIGNAISISKKDKQYTPPEAHEKATEEQGPIKSFFSKLRMKFGF